jgi:prolyl 4-hydroxylase
VYHEFLSDKEVETVKRLATPRFKRATVQNYKTGELETANYRYLNNFIRIGKED